MAKETDFSVFLSETPKTGFVASREEAQLFNMYRKMLGVSILGLRIGGKQVQVPAT